jgi:hypothetical protein
MTVRPLWVEGRWTTTYSEGLKTMRMQVERFLAITAVLATGSMMSVGCVSEDDTDTKTDAQVNTGGTSSGGTGGSSGGTGGSAGTATGGSAGTSTGGAAGGGGTAGAGGACFGDTTVSDAGAEGGIDCSTLPYAATDCGDDAGVEGSPTGVAMCGYIATQGRAGVAEAMLTCLAAIGGDACSSVHDDAVSNCVQTVYSNTCAPADPPNAPSAACAALSGSCPAVAEADCKINLDPLTTDAGNAILDCYEALSGDCAEDFNLCLGLP